MVMTADTGRRRAAGRESEKGSMNSLLGRKLVETKERRRLDKPDTSMSWEVEISILLQRAPTTLAKAPEAAA